MSDPATDYLHAALLSMRDGGARIKAPRAALARLAATAGPASSAPAPARSEKPARPAEAPARPARTERFAPAASAPPPAAPAVLGEYTRISPAEGTKAERLAAMRAPVLACVKCANLAKSRTQVVFGVGNPDAELMFVGEAPGEDEDAQGEPFVGKAGQLLTKIIETMGLRREDVYIGNVLKCRPDMPPGVPGNRKPQPAEMQVCLPYLREQIEIVQPKALVALGATALEGLTGQNIPVGRARGHWQSFEGIPLMVTYHPAYLLRNQALSEKRKVWEDMLAVMEKLALPISDRQRSFFLR